MSTNRGATGADITSDSVRELLADRKIFPGLPEELDEDAELVLDSLGLVWLLHVVEERYGLGRRAHREDIGGLTSFRRSPDICAPPDGGGAG